MLAKTLPLLLRRPLPLAFLALAACSSGGLSAAEQATRCATFADAVAKAGLATTPDEATAREVANTLDGQLSRLGSPAVHDPAVRVHQQLHAVELAAKRGDTSQADKAAQKAREAATEMAEACGLPASRFLG